MIWPDRRRWYDHPWLIAALGVGGWLMVLGASLILVGVAIGVIDLAERVLR